MMGIYLFHNHLDRIRKNEQIKLYCFLLIACIGVFVFLRWMMVSFNNAELSNILRSTTFAITSILTSTGFTLDNYQLWGSWAIAAFLFLMLPGGCTGSTTGGIKLFRISIMMKIIHAKLKSTARPHGVFIPRYGSSPVAEDVVFGVLTFIGLYLVCLVVGTIALSFCDLRRLLF